MSKDYAIVDMQSKSIIRKYNENEFTYAMYKLLYSFDNDLIDVNLLEFSNNSELMDTFVDWYNHYYFVSGNTFYFERISPLASQEEKIAFKKVSHAPIPKDNCYAFVKILKKHKNYYKIMTFNPELILFRYLIGYKMFGYHQLDKKKYFGHSETNVLIGKINRKWHTKKKPRRKGMRNALHYSRYYAYQVDARYYKDMGEPIPRRRGGMLPFLNTWGEWDNERLSSKGNWKYSTKDRHQWEHNLKKVSNVSKLTNEQAIKLSKEIYKNIYEDEIPLNRKDLHKLVHKIKNNKEEDNSWEEEEKGEC